MSTPFDCEVPGCTEKTGRNPHVCTKHFIEGWGRLPRMPLPAKVEDAPLYVSDKVRKRRGK